MSDIDRDDHGVDDQLDPEALFAGHRRTCEPLGGHEMRAIVFLRLNNNKQVLVEIREAADIVGMNSKLHLLNALVRLPGSLPEKTFQFLTLVKDWYRSLRKYL